MRRSAAGALLVGLALLAACSREAAPDRAPPAELQPAPAFTLQDLMGHPVSLESFRGKTVLVDFWATWCPPCEFQVPVLNAFYEAHKAQGVVVLGVAVDAEGRAVVAPYAARHKIRYPVLLGTEALARDYGAPGFPALAVVAPDGSLVTLKVGMKEEDELEKLVAEAQAGASTHARAEGRAAPAAEATASAPSRTPGS